MNSDNDNDHGEAATPTVFIIIGQVYRDKDDEPMPVHVILPAPDDDTAVRHCLDALASRGYAEADLDQIAMLAHRPDEEPHASAYQGALEGEVAIIPFK